MFSVCTVTLFTLKGMCVCMKQNQVLFLMFKKKRIKAYFKIFFLDLIFHGEWAPETLFLVYLGIL